MNTLKIMHFLSKGDKDWCDYTKAEQKEYLDSFPEPKNDFERSFYQYKCQCYFRSRRKLLFQNAVSVLMFPLAVVFLLLRNLCVSKKVDIDCLSEFKNLEDIVPDEIYEKYNVNHDHWGESMCLGIDDLPFVTTLLRTHFTSPYFVFKAVLKVASYSYMIKSYNPNIILVHSEYSFCSSLLTYYCESRGIKHINAMHGEKLFYIGYTFFRYSECYAWSEYYINLLKELRAEPDQFEIAVPKSLLIQKEKFVDSTKYSTYKYYLQIYTERELESILKSLDFIDNKEVNLKLRPHPRFSDMTLLKKHVPEYMIEYPRDVNIQKSIVNCQYVIGYFSTVLYQGYLNGAKVVLDDVTFKVGNSKLKDHDYILSSSNSTIKLSSLQ